MAKRLEVGTILKVTETPDDLRFYSRMKLNRVEIDAGSDPKYISTLGAIGKPETLFARIKQEFVYWRVYNKYYRQYVKECKEQGLPIL